MDYVYKTERNLRQRLLRETSQCVDFVETPRCLEHDGGVHWQAGSTKLDPYTSNVVIVTRQSIPVQVVKNLDFTNPRKHFSLVTEIEYCKDTGDIFYDIAERDNLEDDGYARLITLNWWYQALSQVMMNASLIVLDLYSNVIFGFTLLSRYEAFGLSLEVALFFPVLYVTLEGISLAQSYRHAAREWEIKTSHKTCSGDLIVDDNLSLLDRHHAFYAMVLFNFCGLDTLVRDIVVWLHPFKSVQPFCAFKSDGHRCYLIGWANEYMFRCDSAVRQHVLMTTQLGVRLTMLIFKATVAFRAWDATSIGLCIPSFIFVALRIVTIWQLIEDRSQLWLWLNREFKKVNEQIREIDAEVEWPVESTTSGPAASDPESEFAEEGDPPQLRRSETARRRLNSMLKVLRKQKCVHFPETTWGNDFQGRRSLLMRLLGHVFLPTMFLSAFIVVDLCVFHWRD